MWFPASKVASYRTCGGDECKKAYAKENADRTLAELTHRECRVCGKQFTPRKWLVKNGYGYSCGRACRAIGLRGRVHSREELEKRSASIRRALAEGRLKIRSGPDHPRWKGGPEASVRRQIESGARAAQVRNYRAKNPDKVREFSTKRSAGKTGRLPRGTVPRIGTLQKWKCAICRVSLSKAYHVDHIHPLARGGSHVPANIQLLCPNCNVRKSAKDPMDHMRSLGRLL